jgi:hypothetical protein
MNIATCFRHAVKGTYIYVRIDTDDTARQELGWFMAAVAGTIEGMDPLWVSCTEWPAHLNGTPVYEITYKTMPGLIPTLGFAAAICGAQVRDDLETVTTVVGAAVELLTKPLGTPAAPRLDEPSMN